MKFWQPAKPTDRTSDLVYVKFNYRLKHKRENKAKDPLEKKVVDIGI